MFLGRDFHKQLSVLLEELACFGFYDLTKQWLYGHNPQTTSALVLAMYVTFTVFFSFFVFDVDGSTSDVSLSIMAAEKYIIGYGQCVFHRSIYPFDKIRFKKICADRSKFI